MKAQVCVISARRSENVKQVEQQFEGCVWYVPQAEVKIYRQCGATCVVGVRGVLPMKSKQLNAALDDWSAECDIVATVDDDIVRCLDSRTRKETAPMKVISNVATVLLRSPFFLGGAYTGGNTIWAGGKIKSVGGICGALMVHRKSPVRFSPDLKTLVDLDYVLQHHVRYGGVVKHCGYCVVNLFRRNPGGFQIWRTRSLQRQTIRMMREKWGKYGYKIWEDLSSEQGYQHQIPWKQFVLAEREQNAKPPL